MRNGDECEGCGSASVSFDFNALVLACEACGLVRQETELRHAEFNEEGVKAGVYVGGRGTATSLGGLGKPSWALGLQARNGFKTDVKKKYAIAKVDELSALLHLPRDKIDDVKHMIKQITEDSWGRSRWMDILIGTCIYFIARRHHLPLSAAEISATLSCPVCEIMRVYQRVLDFMDIESPAMDPSVHFDKFVSHSPAFVSVERDKLRKQGHCLLQCGIDWCISTGRHPLAIVAAVVVIVGQANNIKVDIEEVSRSLLVHPATSRLRLKEYMDSLVGFGQRLPWGKDITSKTVSRHLPFLLQYLETRMRMGPGRVLPKDKDVRKPREAGKELVKRDDMAIRHIARALCAKYGPEVRRTLESPFSVSIGVSDALPEKEVVDGNDKKKIKLDDGKSQAAEACPPWKPLPPSFVANELTESLRILKIGAAKERITAVKQEMASDLVRRSGKRSADEQTAPDSSSPEMSHAVKHTDAEDLLIQYCLIRGGDEKLLRAGYYSLVLSTPPVQPDETIMSDEDLLKYFRSPREIAFLQSLSQEEPLAPWLSREEQD